MLSTQLQFHDVTSLLTGMRSSMTRTTMCWEWRRLPSTTRARSRVWQKTALANWRPQPLSQSEVRNTFVLCYLSTLANTQQHLEKSWPTEVYTNTRFRLAVYSGGSPLHKWKSRMLTPTAERDVDSLWTSLIIYISNCGVDTLCHPPPPVMVVC